MIRFRPAIMFRFFCALSLAGLSSVVSNCTAPFQAPDLGGIYNRSARQHDLYRNPVIVIPGILGSRLRDRDSGRTVWGTFASDYISPRTAEGARLVALPMREGASLGALQDSVFADQVLDRISLRWLSLPLEQKAYYYLLRVLGAGGYRDQTLGSLGAIDYGSDHFTCFQFPYDWRRDIVENARSLHEFILEKRKFVQEQFEKRYGLPNHPIKFDIVAHSMGGLLTRYYLRYGTDDLPSGAMQPKPTWKGSEHVERAILIGTPNAGSLRALEYLVEGVRFTLLLPKFDAAILGTMPAIYQLLPRARHRRVVESGSGDPLDVFDPAVWTRMKWGLVSPEQAAVLEVLLPDVKNRETRHRIALDHLGKNLARARKLAEALDLPAAPPPHLTLQLIAADSQTTTAVLEVNPINGNLKVLARGPGDGTVLRDSAIFDERVGGPWSPRLVSPIQWDRVNFVFADHLGMTRDPVFMDNLLFQLLEAPRQNPKGESVKNQSSLSRQSPSP